MIPNTNTSLKEKSFDEIAKQYEKLVSKLTKKYDVPNYTKDDIKQEVLMILWNAYNTYEEGKGATFTHYFIKSFKYKISRLITYNQEASYIEDEEYDLDKRNLFKSEENIERDHKQKELDKELWSFIDSLPNGRTARYYYIGQMNLERIAQIEKVSPQAIHDRIKTIHKQLRRKYGDDIVKFIAEP